MWLQFNFPTLLPFTSSLFTCRAVVVSKIDVLPGKLLFILQNPVSASSLPRPDERKAVLLQLTVPQPPAWVVGKKYSATPLSSLALAPRL